MASDGARSPGRAAACGRTCPTPCRPARGGAAGGRLRVCRTDLHVRDGELPGAVLPAILGHEVVGRVVTRGPAATRFAEGDRVGVPGSTDVRRVAPTARRAARTSARRPVSRGTSVRAATRSSPWPTSATACPIPEGYGDVEAAPLLCAGLIGYRALRKAGDAARLGLYGFGAAAHIVAQLARHEGRRVFRLHAARRRGGRGLRAPLGRGVGRQLGRRASEELDAAIIFAPVGALVPAALRAVARGARWCAPDPHERDPGHAYELLWGERRCARWRTSRGATARRSSRWRRGCRCGPRWRRSRWPRPRTHCADCARATSRARPCWCRERRGAA